MNKFQVGQKVRILWDKVSAYGDNDSGYRDKGEVIDVDYPGRGKISVKGFYEGDPEWNLSFKPEELELVSSTPHIRNVIVKVPTKEDWIAVVRQAIKDGCEWDKTIYDGADFPKEGDDYCNILEINSGGMLIGWDGSSDNYPNLTTQEYLNKFKQSSDEPNKQRTKIMNKITGKIKRIFSPALQKQYKAGLIDDCGDLTENGREEMDILVRDLIEDDFTKRAEEIIKEEKENK